MPRFLFATFGIPYKMVLDNGTAFVSAENGTLYENNVIRHSARNVCPVPSCADKQAERYMGELEKVPA